jgi:hypothetical protein
MTGIAPRVAAVPVNSTAMPRFTGIVVTLWAGSLWTICGLVAPTLFALLEDRSLAGRLAARFFDLVTLIGVAAGVLLLALTFTGRYVLPGRHGRLLVASTASLPALSELLLSPLMEQARASGNMARFGMLHGIAAAVFMIACGGALLVVWNFTRPAGSRDA